MSQDNIPSNERAFIEHLRSLGRFYVVPVTEFSEHYLSRWLRESNYRFSIPILPGETLDEAMARKPASETRVCGIPFVIVEDPTMPPDQIELRSRNGQVVRVVGLAVKANSPLCDSPDKHMQPCECLATPSNGDVR
jgi:hypothetical protein